MMNPKSSSILTIFTLITLFFCANFELGFCREFGVVSLKNFGAIRDLTSSSSEIESIARFAVEEHNKKENTLLRFGRVLKAEEQVVAGKIYHLTLEAIDAGKKTVYEAKVWVKPWMNFRQLQEFKRSIDIPHFRIVDRIAHDGLGWHKVPIHDPEVQDAANHAVEDIQKRSNCVCTHKLLEIVQAEKEVVKDFVRYNLLLKLSLGTVEEKLNVKVHRDANGSFKCNSIELFDV